MAGNEKIQSYRLAAIAAYEGYVGRSVEEMARDAIKVENWRLGSDEALSADYSAIMRAVDEADSGSGGRTVVFGAQTYTTNGQIRSPDRIGFEGQGYCSLLQWPPGVTSELYDRSLITSANTDQKDAKGIRFKSMRFLTHAELRDPTVHVRNIYLNSGSVGNFFEDVWLEPTNGQNISVYGTSSSDPEWFVRDDPDNFFFRVRMLGAGITGQAQVGSGFTVTGTLLDCYGTHAKTNVVKSGRANVLYCKFIDNGGGLETDETGDYHGMNCIGNLFYNSGGIYMGGSQDDAVCKDNRIFYARYNGIRVVNTNRRISITGNVIANCGTKTSWPATEPDESLVRDSTKGFDAIGIMGSTGIPRNIEVAGNFMYDDRTGGDKTMEYGIYCGTDDSIDLNIHDNHYGSAEFGDDLKVGTHYVNSALAAGELRMRNNINSLTEKLDGTQTVTSGGTLLTMVDHTFPANSLHRSAQVKGTMKGIINTDAGDTAVVIFNLGATAVTIMTATGATSDVDWWCDFQIDVVRVNEATLTLRAYNSTTGVIYDRKHRVSIALASTLALTVTAQSTVVVGSPVVTFRMFDMEQVR